MKRIFVDERTERINGLVSFVCLILTQLALVGVVVYIGVAVILGFYSLVAYLGKRRLEKTATE